MIQIRGEGKYVMVMAQGVSDAPTSGNSALVLAQNNGTNVVRQLRLAPLGITLHYGSHKGEARNVAMATGNAQRVPVRVSGR